MTRKESLAKNTLMLYLLTGSNYFFGLVTVPYLTRVLGVETYGTIGFAMSYAAIVQMVLDFGFQLSAVIDVANNQNDHAALERIVTSVTLAKLVLVIPSFMVVIGICSYVPRFRADAPLFLLYFVYAVLNSLVPDFFYRGMEDMTTVTVRNVVMKAVFATCVVVFVKSPTQCLLVPVFYSLGSMAALAVMLQHMRKDMGVWFVRVSIGEVWNQFIRSALFFLSRAAGSIYTSFNTMVLGILFPTGPVVGYYAVCNTLINAGRQAITPITGSFFPHIVRTKNYSLLLRALTIGEIILVSGSIVVGALAKPLCVLLFGAEYADAAVLLRFMLPLIPITLATYLCGWSGLGALGLERVTNTSVLIGSAFQIAGLAICLVTDMAKPELICSITVFSELIVLLIRAVAMSKGLKVLREGHSATADIRRSA